MNMRLLELQDNQAASSAACRRPRLPLIQKCERFLTLPSRECPALHVSHSMTGERVADTLERLAYTRALPKVITVDQGPEFTSRGPPMNGPDAAA